MHLPVLPALVLLATTAAAEHMFVSEYCATLVCNRNGRFVTNWGDFQVDAGDGCRGTPVPNMVEWCIDTQRERGHFRYEGQGKRCMVVESSEWQRCSDDWAWATCASEVWKEVNCTW